LTIQVIFDFFEPDELLRFVNIASDDGSTTIVDIDVVKKIMNIK
jgi:hypothetical protein